MNLAGNAHGLQGGGVVPLLQVELAVRVPRFPKAALKSGIHWPRGIGDGVISGTAGPIQFGSPGELHQLSSSFLLPKRWGASEPGSASLGASCLIPL